MSAPEDALCWQIAAAGLPEPVRESREPWAGTGRKFRADLAFPAARLYVEVHGGVWTGGRHTSGAGFERDCVKRSLAAANGWRCVEVTAGMVKDGSALGYVERALQGTDCG